MKLELSTKDAKILSTHLSRRLIDMQNELNWDTRIFDDRQRLLPAVCEQPVLLEQRLYQLSHAVMDDMAK